MSACHHVGRKTIQKPYKQYHMKENKETDKKQNTVIDTNAFIRTMSFAGTKNNMQPTGQPMADENGKTDEAEAIQSENDDTENGLAVKPEEPEKQLSRRKKNQNGIDYPSVFLCRYELKSRQGIYIEKETNETVKQIVHSIGDARLTVSGFIENVLKHHFEMYKDEINNLYESKFRKPIK